MKQSRCMLRAVMSIVLVAAMLLSMVGCAIVPMVKDNSQNQTSTRQEQEKVVEVLGNGSYTKDEISQMKDKELQNLVNKLLGKLDRQEGFEENSGFYDENGAMTLPFDQAYPELVEEGILEYDEETLLVKLGNSQGGKITDGMKAAGVAALELLFALEESSWYEAKLVAGTDATKAIEALRKLKEVQLTEYNFRVQTAALDPYADVNESLGLQDNEKFSQQWHMHHCGIPAAYEVMTEPGGNSSVVVAVIDTGVDYDHEDLANNIWVNVNEIPDNGMDDDGNGYVDDYYGVDIVAGYGNGDDDNGHGTHVAGIIAAENNNIGAVGIAYNVKIMPIKAAMASGYLHQSDIAKAILYAFEMGAEVINMSFGGVQSSIAVQDALAVAYSRCVLVASAGNDGAYNEGLGALPNYPAALTYVLGVMSVGQGGKESAFTNYDVDAFSSVEYELYAPGENIMSTLPNDQYGALSGTSMAAPVVAAMAAILRSEFADRDMYPTKFIYGQLASTSGYCADCLNPSVHGLHNIPQVADLYSALTKLPRPEVNLQDFHIFDTESLAEGNNGDGVIDAGEYISLGLTLRNRWGMSQDTIVTIDTLAFAGIPDPYITIVNPEVNYGSVGTYSTQDCGRIYTDEIITGWKNPFYLQIAKDCPNDYIFRINVTITCGNALDPNDTSVYTTYGTVELAVRNGYVVPSVIDEDMVWTADNLYIIPNGTVITAGTTVRVEPGTRIQFWSDDPEDPYADTYIAYLRVNGNFFVEGTKENPVKIYPSELMSHYAVCFGGGNVVLEYADVTNYSTDHTGGITEAYGCVFRKNYAGWMRGRSLSDGNVYDTGASVSYSIGRMENCTFYKIDSGDGRPSISGSAYSCLFAETTFHFGGLNAQDCVFLANNNGSYTQDEWSIKSASQTVYSIAFGVSAENVNVFYRPETGTTYVAVNDDTGIQNVILYVRELGGEYAIMETEDEHAWLKANLPKTAYDSIYGSTRKVGYAMGMRYDYVQDCFVWADGTPNTTVKASQQHAVGATAASEMAYYNGMFSDDFYNDHSDCNSGDWCNEHRVWYLYELPGLVHVTDIQFPDYEILLDMESSYLINVTTKPIQVPVNQLHFESRDENVVTVDETGLIKPVGPGTTDVYVYCNDRAVYNYITVTVKDYVALESISPNVEYMELAAGNSTNVKWNLWPVDTTRRQLTFTSSNEDVAIVDAYGRITGVGSGEAVITASSTEVDANGNPIQTSVTVSVYQAITELKLEQDAMVVQHAAGTADLPNAVYSAGGEPMLHWTTLDPKVATVENGKLVVKCTTNLTTTLVVEDLRTGLKASCLVWVLDEELPVVKKMEGTGEYSPWYALMEDGRLFHWGGLYGEDASPRTLKCVLKDVVDFTVAGGYVRVIRTNGTLESYYDNGEGLVVDERIGFSDLPVGAIGVAAYDRNTIVWMEDGTVYACGPDNAYGQLGLGYYEPAVVFGKIDLTGVVSVVMKPSCTYFLTNDGKLYMTGGSSYMYTTPVLITENVKQFCSVGDKYSNSIRVQKTDGSLYYVNGENVSRSYELSAIYDKIVWCDEQDKSYGILNGQLFAISTMPDLHEDLVSGITNVVDVWFDGDTCFVKTADGLLYGFGRNDCGQLVGASNSSYVYEPVMVSLVTLSPDKVECSGMNMDNGVLRQEELILSFNKKLLSGKATVYANDMQVRATVTFKDINKLYIVPDGGFKVGVNYTVKIYAYQLNAVPDLYNTEDIVISFTYEPEEIQEIVGGAESPVVHEAVLDPNVERFYWTAANFAAKVMELHKELNLNYTFVGNAILNPISTDFEVNHWLRILASASSGSKIPLGGNYWGTTNEQAIGLQIIDYSDFPDYGQVIYKQFLTSGSEKAFPFVTGITIFNEDGEKATTVGNEWITVRVTFNRDMDVSIPLQVRFGSYYPYGDYTIPGNYVDARTWEGTYKLNTIIENGYQYFSISNGCSADGEMDLYTDQGRFLFAIDTTAAQALIMQGNATSTGIELSWQQDDFDTLMGYNVYRSTSEDGYYHRVNTAVIPADQLHFFDDTVEPGVTYFYNFTVVQTDLTESVPSGKISIMSMDTMAPDIYHSPVSNATEGVNLVVSATVTDNLAITYAKLYYRVVGQTQWQSVSMSGMNDKYSAIITAQFVTTEGLEYYIEAFDGVSFTYKGSAEKPYVVSVRASVSADELGDVDGDGQITNLDALLLLYAINDKYNMTAEEFARADLNGDGVLSAAEALMILRYVSGEIKSLKMS